MNILEKISDNSQKELFFKYKSLQPPFFNVIAFAKELGLEVKESNELPDKTCGFIKKIVETGQIFICVNSKHHENRKRFTVAHELGHYFMHQDKLQEGIVDSILKREDGINNSIENEANKFAASLLMPKEPFVQLWEKDECSITDMSSIFVVSESAIITRAKFLNLALEHHGYFI